MLTPTDNQLFSSYASPEQYATAAINGLSEAIQDSQHNWDPTPKELLSILKPSEDTNKIILASFAYAVAKKLSCEYPGPAILLFGAAIDILESNPRTELADKIQSAKTKIRDASLQEDPDIKEMINGASEFAKLDKVSEKLRQGFSAGLKQSSKYSDEDIKNLIPRIVEATHAVRHKGIIYRFGWNFSVKEDKDRGSSDASFFQSPKEVIFTGDLLKDLLEPAKIGCANVISKKAVQLRNRTMNYDKST